jgi:hypothetical protein
MEDGWRRRRRRGEEGRRRRRRRRREEKEKSEDGIVTFSYFWVALFPLVEKFSYHTISGNENFNALDKFPKAERMPPPPTLLNFAKLEPKN